MALRDEKTDLIGSIQENLSPDALVMIASYLRTGTGSIDQPDTEAGQNTTSEVIWFANLLADTVGTDEYNRKLNELGM